MTILLKKKREPNRTKTKGDIGKILRPSFILLHPLDRIGQKNIDNVLFYKSYLCIEIFFFKYINKERCFVRNGDNFKMK